MYSRLLIGSLLMCAVFLPFSVRGEENPGYILVMKQVKKLVLPVTYFDYHVDGSNPDFGTRMTNRTTWAQGGSEAYANEANWVDSFLTEDKVPRRHPSLQDPLLDESWYIERIFKPWASGITDTLLWKTPPLIETTPRYDSTTGDLVLDTAGNVIYDTVKTEYPDTLIVSDTMFKSIKLEDFDSISWIANDLTYEDTTDSIWFLGDLAKEDPLGERGFGFENDEIMNSGYTYVLRNKITYNKGDSIVMSGDDDCYLFINGKLALEQGGLHSPSPTTCYLDSLNLTEGEKYDIDFFFAERRTGGNFMLYTNIKFDNVEKEFLDTLYDTIPIAVKHRYYGAFQKGTVHGMSIPEATRDVRIEYFSISGVKLLDIKQPLSTAVKNQNVDLPRGMYTIRATFLNAKGKVIHSAASRKMIVRR